MAHGMRIDGAQSPAMWIGALGPVPLPTNGLQSKISVSS